MRNINLNLLMGAMLTKEVRELLRLLEVKGLGCVPDGGTRYQTTAAFDIEFGIDAGNSEVDVFEIDTNAFTIDELLNYDSFSGSMRRTATNIVVAAAAAEFGASSSLEFVADDSTKFGAAVHAIAYRFRALEVGGVEELCMLNSRGREAKFTIEHSMTKTTFRFAEKPNLSEFIDFISGGIAGIR